MSKYQMYKNCTSYESMSIDELLSIIFPSKKEKKTKKAKKNKKR